MKTKRDIPCLCCATRCFVALMRNVCSANGSTILITDELVWAFRLLCMPKKTGEPENSVKIVELAAKIPCLHEDQSLKHELTHDCRFTCKTNILLIKVLEKI
jgi:hypothetical protein